MITEERLAQLRRNAQPMAPERGYYGLPFLKEPVWTWEVPAYFFVGGAAGAAAVVGAAAQLTGADRALVRDARWVALAGSALSGPLLVGDLGRPERFLNMLRVFKPKSPMSVGAWTLTVFGTSAGGAVLAGKVRVIGDACGLLSASAGLVMATYTGVLIGATSIPAWADHASMLPIHFGASALSSAVSMLELLGHEQSALNILGFVAAIAETVIGYQMGTEPTLAMKAGGVLSGPLPALLRLAGFRSKRLRRVAAGVSILGSLVTRIAWVDAGKSSARNTTSTRKAIGERKP